MQESIQSAETSAATNKKSPVPKVNFPVIDESMNDLIKRVLLPGNSTDVIVTGFGLQITRGDINTLSGLNWINDEIINFYMNLSIQRGSLDGFPKVYAMNSFFYPKLLSSGYSGVKRWTAKIDLLSCELIVIPIHLGIHWCVSVINLKKKTKKYFDSMGSPNEHCLQSLKEYFKQEHFDKKKRFLDLSNWKFENVQNIPKQNNDSDCGVFSCMYAEFLCAKRELNFSQNNMQYFRKKIIYETITGQLL